MSGSVVVNGTDFPIFDALSQSMACCGVEVGVFQSSRKSNSRGKAGWGRWLKGQMDLMVGWLQFNKAILDEHSAIAILI